jgi:hypothetical protein
MEGVTAGQPTDIIVIFKGINADGTRITRGLQTLRWQCSVDMLVALFAIHTMKTSAFVRVRGLACFSRFRWCILCSLRSIILLVVLILGGDLGILGSIRCRCGCRCGIGSNTIRRVSVVGCKIRDDSICATNTVGAALREVNATGSRQSLSSPFRDPSLVFHHWELVIDLVHCHELFLATSTMRTRHILHVDWLAVFAHAKGSVASVVAETVFDTNDDPNDRLDVRFRGTFNGVHAVQNSLN